MTLITKDNSIQDLLVLSKEHNIHIQLVIETNTAELYIRDSKAINAKYELLTVNNWHGFTINTPNDIGGDLTEFLDNIKSKQKFKVIKKLLDSNNISTQDIENYLSLIT